MPYGGNLTIVAYSKKQNVTIDIKDTGEGIPQEVRDKLYSPLVTTKSKGQGFGLAVVKRMAEAINCTITFDSEQGKGTKFTLQFQT